MDFSSYVYVQLAAETTFVQKTRVFCIDEIDGRCQFHQHSMSSFFECRSKKGKKTSDNLTICFVLLESAIEKSAHKMLVKLSPSVNFINVKRTNFSYKRPSPTYILALLKNLYI